MPESSGLPILAELGEQLTAGFRRRETQPRARPAGAAPPWPPSPSRGAAVALAFAARRRRGARPGVGQAASARAPPRMPRTRSRSALPRPGQFLFVRARARPASCRCEPHADTPLPLGALAGAEGARRPRPTGFPRASTRDRRRSPAGCSPSRFPTAAARALWVCARQARASTRSCPRPWDRPRWRRSRVGAVSLSIGRLLRFPADPRAIDARLFAGDSPANVLSRHPERSTSYPSARGSARRHLPRAHARARHPLRRAARAR